MAPFPSDRDREDDPPEPPRLRALRRMVAVLTATLILGVVTVAGALVIRIAGAPAPPPDPAAVTAERVALPADEAIVAVGGGPGVVIVATRDAEGRERLRVFDAGDGAPGAVVEVDRAGR
jgi:hypothetical protein